MGKNFVKALTLLGCIFLIFLKSYAAEYEFRSPLTGTINSSSKILRMKIIVQTSDKEKLILFEKYESELEQIALEEIQEIYESDLKSYHFLDTLSARITNSFLDFLGSNCYRCINKLRFSELYFDGTDILQKQKFLNRNLSVSEAKIKGLQIRGDQNTIKSILRSFNKKEETAKQKTEFLCEVKSKPCDFSIAGERISQAKLIFISGIMREAVFIITEPGLNQGPIDPRPLEKLYEKYNAINEAFIEKFGLPFRRFSSATAKYGKVTETFWFERYKEPSGKYNEWIFGNDEITIESIFNSPRANLPIHIEISMKDKQYYDQKADLEKQQKLNQIELERSQDFQRRKKDF
jgi:hypothetical protein